jgi:hypothetical protein
MGASREGRRAQSGSDAFPWLVALGCLAAGLFVWFGSTVPALREREILEDARVRMEERRDALRKAAVELRGRRQALPRDGELLMVEIDRHGLLPHEAVELYHPEPSAQGPATRTHPDTSEHDVPPGESAR